MELYRRGALGRLSELVGSSPPIPIASSAPTASPASPTPRSSTWTLEASPARCLRRGRQRVGQGHPKAPEFSLGIIPEPWSRSDVTLVTMLMLQDLDVDQF
jgi:hypothetical protein